jgi:tryptophanyl-tRNA synthetase
MNILEEIKNILDKNNAKYKLHKVPEGTGISVEEHIKAFNLDFSDGCATLIFSTDNGFIALMRRDDCKLESKKLKKILGVKNLRLASPDELKQSTGFDIGMVSPFLINLPVFIDKKVLDKESVRVGSGGNEFSLEVNTKDLLRITNAQIVDVTEINPDKTNLNIKKRILTGDRPTGKLHIGHLMGSLNNRVKFQDEYETFILIANIHALADNRDNPEKVKNSISELLCDYYAAGIDFDKATIYIQSEVPETHEIFMYLANFVSLQQLMHNPTLKTEIAQNKMEESTPLGFFIYPTHQAADILCVNANLVPVGKDQAPMIEDCREVARKFNNTYNVNVFGQPQALFGLETNVPGIDGNVKMGKSLNNGIYLADSEEELKKKIMNVYTDPTRIHASDPGHLEGNVAFAYHDLFNENKEEVQDLKERYIAGKVGDVEVKEKLFTAMSKGLKPIRERRIEAETKKDELLEKALDGSKKVKGIARGIADQMKEAMKIRF